MTEENFSLPCPDGKRIYGIVNRSKTPARKAAVFCHGLTGHMHEHLYETGKRFFTERGYDTIRFDFYGSQPEGRRITECNVSQHVEDLRTLLAYFAPLYDKLYVSGHSYGGLTILSANPENVAAVSFWDGTFRYIEHDPWRGMWHHNKELGESIMLWHPARVIGRKMHEEQATFKSDRLNALAQAFKRPGIVLAAGAEDANLPNQKRLFENLGCEKDFYAVPGATHCFEEGDTVFDLLEKTYRWYERF